MHCTFKLCLHVSVAGSMSVCEWVFVPVRVASENQFQSTKYFWSHRTDYVRESLRFELPYRLNCVCIQFTISIENHFWWHFLLSFSSIVCLHIVYGIRRYIACNVLALAGCVCVLFCTKYFYRLALVSECVCLFPLRMFTSSFALDF